MRGNRRSFGSLTVCYRTLDEAVSDQHYRLRVSSDLLTLVPTSRLDTHRL